MIVALPTPMADGRWGRRLCDARVVRPHECVPAADVRTSPNPIDVVTRHLLPPGFEPAGKDVGTVCDEASRCLEEAASKGSRRGLTVAVLECFPDWPAWPAWAAFLSQWAQASRNKERELRIAFVAIVAGAAVQALPREDDSLRIRTWDAAGEADIWTFAQIAFSDWPGTPLQRRVVASIAANLAVWDPEVVSAMASAPLDAILEPEPILKRLGKERGWHRLSESQLTWEAGHCAATEYGTKVHSSALALLGESSLLTSRIWAGQIAVLLPFVEELRLRTISELRPLLRVPWRTRFDEIIDPRDLEISHLCDQVEQLRLPLQQKLRSALPLLRVVRNRLAHLEVVDAAVLRDPRIAGAYEAGLSELRQ